MWRAQRGSWPDGEDQHTDAQRMRPSEKTRMKSKAMVATDLCGAA
jgi:hypothetical protein